MDNKIWDEIIDRGNYKQIYKVVKENKTESFMTRMEWDGVHFLTKNGTYAILLKSGEVLVNPNSVYRTDYDDWLLVTITDEATDILQKLGFIELDKREYNGVFEERASWDDYFIEIANVVKKRSTCGRRKVGAVIVKDNRILSTGYNGAPTGIKHCTEVGCKREMLNVPSGKRQELCRALHAEQNAIIQAANSGTGLKGSTLFVTTKPCVMCTKMCINAGVTRIVYEEGYPDELSDELLKEAGIEIVKK